MGLFEGTIMSMGRGTPWPFEVLGAPWFKEGDFEFTPQNIPGKAVNPPYKGELCKGLHLDNFAMDYLKDYRKIYLLWLIEMYKSYGSNPEFFNSFFDKLAGTPRLREQIIGGKSETEIRKSWEADLIKFKTKRKKYLIYTHDEERGILHPTKTYQKP